jgi:hypothetical protein
MLALVASIHDFLDGAGPRWPAEKDVDGRHKADHDDGVNEGKRSRALRAA